MKGKITYPIIMAMSAEFIQSKEARQSIYDRLRSKPNPVYYSKKMKEMQTEMDNSANGDSMYSFKVNNLVLFSHNILQN